MVTSFPKDEATRNNGIFNHRFVQSMSITHDVSVIHLRSWLPFRVFRKRIKYDGLSVTQINLPYYDFLRPFFTNLCMFFYKRMLRVLVGKELSSAEIIHSVNASLAGVCSSHLSKKTGIPHIAQCNGTDVNLDIPLMHKYSCYKGWESQVDVFGCNSLALKNAVLKLYPNARVDVIYRGVNLNNFSFAENAVSAKIKFLFLGGLSNRKGNEHHWDYKGGYSTLKAALQLVALDRDFELLFGGPGVNQDIVKTLLADRYDILAPHLQILGRLDPEQVRDVMISANVVLVPSMMEGLPNIAMEAMATGRPVIGSNVGGIPELVINDHTGYLVEAGDFKGICNRMDYYINYPNAVVEHGVKARKLMEESFHSAKGLESYKELYAHINQKI